MKTCPYCMGEILDKAKKCKYCGERVVDIDNPFRDEKGKVKLVETDDNIDNEELDDDIDDDELEDNIDDEELEDNIDDEELEDNIDDEELDDDIDDEEDDKSNDSYRKDDENSGSGKKNKSFKWVWIVVVVLILISGFFSSINKDRQKQQNVETVKKLYDKAIDSEGNLEISDAVDLMNNYIPQNSTEEKAFKKVTEFLTNYSNKMNSFSDDLFYIDDIDLHNTYLINSAIDQYNEYKNLMIDYANKSKEFGNEFGIMNDKSKYSYYDLVSHIELFTSQEAKLADKAIAYYSYVLDIQNDFYYDKDEDQIYFYSDSSDYSLNRFNTLWKDYASTLLETADIEEEYSEYYVEYLKYNKDKMN